MLLLKDLLELRFIRNQIYKYTTSISKNVYIEGLDEIVNKYNNTYHRTIKMTPADVKVNTYIDFDKEGNNKNHKFQVVDQVRISKYENIFAKGYSPNWSEESFVIKKFKNTVPWIYVFSDINGKEIVGTNQKEFRIEKVIKK